MKSVNSPRETIFLLSLGELADFTRHSRGIVIIQGMKKIEQEMIKEGGRLGLALYDGLLNIRL